jgi:hypothetical protein
MVDKFSIHFFTITYLKLMVKCKTHLCRELNQANLYKVKVLSFVNNKKAIKLHL